jgi:Uma2 family endonuclease
MFMDTAFRSEERFTQAEFWDWLETLPASAVGNYELINGRIVVTPPARWPHAVIGSTICRLVGQHVAERGLGLTFDSSGGFDFTLGPKRRDTLQPDFSFIARERWQAGPIPRAGAKGFLPIVPNLVVEILSPSTAKRDRGEKRRIYARAGVDEYWLVDPELQVVTVHHRVERWFEDGDVVASGGIIASRVLPDLGLAVDALFADLR